MSFTPFDVVTLRVDLPGEKLYRGMQGVVIDIYEEPEKAYEVEFCDDEGNTISQIALLPDQIA
ncbi:DUF4926 domain-containing protein [Pantoea sp. Mb-10]|uniref:DUF4926 domain-containing protein n=1 Tax=unclassified Pantoea TaxID=2630326 RepID=UPI001E4ED71A|nr:DUF4926 domain-containing protein [Pantoea sp. Mb-10]MCE0500895.1 DUF4926 domain-containing protein [Pantoea sp. Pb-8]